MRWFVGSDHGGVELRGLLAGALAQRGCEIAGTFGPAAADEPADYPDVAAAVCQAIAARPGAYGLLVCGTGQGMAIAANRWPHIRAGVVLDTFSAAMLRAHNDANVLCLGQRVLGPGLAVALLDAFLAASFEGGRHARRVAKLGAAGRPE